MRIETALVVVGSGPAALVVAKVAAGRGLPCLLAGHEPGGDETVVTLTPGATAVLAREGILDVLRPYAAASDPFAVSPAAFEDVLKHHCVADVNVTVYDRVTVVDRAPGHGEAGGDDRVVRAVLTDGRARWELVAGALVDTAAMPVALSAAIEAGTAAALAVLDARSRARPAP